MAITTQVGQNPAYTRTIIEKISKGSESTMAQSHISLARLVRAQKKFEQSRRNLTTPQEKWAALRTFVFCFDLAWYTTKKLLQQDPAIQLKGPRETIHLAAQSSLIDDADLWLTFIDARNVTYRAYEEEAVNNALTTFPQFSSELKTLLSRLEKALG